MLVERHIFGSIRGYGTLAQSPGLAPAECRLLENFNFGQPQDAEYLASLAKTPAYWIRPLGARRRVLTRVVRGMADDQGRSTVLLISAVLSAADWDGVLRGDISILLRKDALWQWDGTPQLHPLEVATSPPSQVSIGRGSVEKLLSLITLIEHNHGRHRSVVVREADLSADEMRGLEMLMPPSARGGFSSAYRSLNSRLVASVNCVADGVVIDQAAEVFVPGRPLPRSFYAGVLHDAGLSTGRVDTGFIATYAGFGKFASPEAGGRVAPPGSQPVIVVPAAHGGSRVALLAGWLLAAALLIALCFTWLSARPAADAGNTTVETPAAVTFSEAQWGVFVNASKDLLSPNLLPRDKNDRKAVVDGYHRLVESIPGDSSEKHALQQSLRTFKAAADALDAFEEQVTAADADLSKISMDAVEPKDPPDAAAHVYAHDCERIFKAKRLFVEFALDHAADNDARIASQASLDGLRTTLNKLTCLLPDGNVTLQKLQQQEAQLRERREQHLDKLQETLDGLRDTVLACSQGTAGPPMLRTQSSMLVDIANGLAVDDPVGKLATRVAECVKQLADYVEAQQREGLWQQSRTNELLAATAKLGAVRNKLEAYSGDDARSEAEKGELRAILLEFKEALAVLTPAASQPATP
jgi:hypothetical protein